MAKNALEIINAIQDVYQDKELKIVLCGQSGKKKSPLAKDTIILTPQDAESKQPAFEIPTTTDAVKISQPDFYRKS